jgi:hypothetical protein
VDEHRLEAMAERVAAQPEKLKQRKTLVEHRFGTLKHWWDHGHFLLRGLPKVRAEFSLRALAYTRKRVLNIVGVHALLRCLDQRRSRSPQMRGGCGAQPSHGTLVQVRWPNQMGWAHRTARTSFPA